MAKGELGRSLGRVAMAAALLAAAASATANVLVVRSSGPSAAAYPAGKSLPDNRRIALRQGDSVTVLDARGTRIFRGPGRFNPSAPAPIASIPAAPGEVRPRVAAVRAAPFVPGSDASIWQIDAAQSGTHCLAGDGAPSLWRADASAAAQATLEAPDGSRREIAWAAGEESALWPADLPAGDGADYELRQPDVAVPARIRLRRIAPPPSDIPAIAAALIEAGCQAQLDLLVDSLG